jgi:hypothetical protein
LALYFHTFTRKFLVKSSGWKSEDWRIENIELKIAVKSKAPSLKAMAAGRQPVAGNFLTLLTDNERQISY